MAKIKFDDLSGWMKVAAIGGMINTLVIVFYFLLGVFWGFTI